MSNKQMSKEEFIAAMKQFAGDSEVKSAIAEMVGVRAPRETFVATELALNPCNSNCVNCNSLPTIASAKG